MHGKGWMFQARSRCDKIEGELCQREKRNYVREDNVQEKHKSSL